MDVLDNLVFDEIKKLALDPDYLNKIKTPQENDNRQSVIENQIESIKIQINKLMDLIHNRWVCLLICYKKKSTT